MYVCIYYFIGTGKLEYLKDSNAAAHSVDSDIFYEVIHLPASFKTYINLYCLKQCRIVRNLFLCDCLVCINFERDDALIAKCDKGSRQCFGHKAIHINLPFFRSRKLEIVEAEI